MKTYTLALLIGCIVFLVGCTEYPTRQLQEVKVVGHVPTKEEGSGIGWKLTYEHWIYENTTTKERFTSMDKMGEVGEVVKIRR